jgi:uncharacterized protein (TIGR02266 family)
MRLLTLAYPSPEAFLGAYDEATHTLRGDTKTEAAIGEKMMVEVSYPGLPNRPLLRARVVEVLDEGLKLTISAEDVADAEFMCKLARNQIPAGGAMHREYKRFPSALPVRFARDGVMVRSQVEDLSAGGCFVKADTPPPVGTFVALDITAPDESQPLHMTGLVCWVREGEKPGFGVEFDQPDTPDGRRLRTILRRAIGTGEVDL